MKGFLIKGLMFALMIAFGSGNAFAEPSAKVTCNVTGIKAFDNSQGESLLFSNTIKTAEQKELFIDVSLESGLTTNTKVVSKSLQRAISEAYAMVEVSVTVDGKMAQPGWVTFARRSQALIAKFAGDITGCLDGEGHFILDDGSCIQDEELALILDTMSANAFNFIAVDVPVGTHTVEVWTRLTWGSSGDEKTDAELKFIDVPVTQAYIGHGSVTVEEVRMVN